ECVENCKLHESKYVCQMKTKNRKSLTLYCPAENSQEYSQDHERTSLYCKIDNNYYLCHKSLQYNQALEHYWISIETNKRECIQVNFIALQDHKHIADGHSLRKEITELIAKWNNGYLRDKAKSGLIKSKNLRIDLQGVFPRENQRYYNLQIQINRPRINGESTTVSQVLIPVDPEIPASYVHRAFTESF
uniref:Uncharacterized protein n=1 Tax=Astyanax mexicanus TaxID=7994 RepID=A0A3B1JFT4_ASTMX